MNIWLIVSIWILLYLLLSWCIHILNEWDEDSDIISETSYTIGYFVISITIGPILAIVNIIRCIVAIGSGKKEKNKKESKKYQPSDNTIGFKTKSEIMAMEARKNES